MNFIPIPYYSSSPRYVSVPSWNMLIHIFYQQFPLFWTPKKNSHGKILSKVPTHLHRPDRVRVVSALNINEQRRIEATSPMYIRASRQTVRHVGMKDSGPLFSGIRKNSLHQSMSRYHCLRQNELMPPLLEKRLTRNSTFLSMVEPKASTNSRLFHVTD